MIKLLNTLYVTSPDAYLSLEGETVVILKGDVAAARIPLHNLCSIVSFGYTGCSPALMGSCAARGIDLCFLTQHGRFLARVQGPVNGNVLLRQTQALQGISLGQSCIMRGGAWNGQSGIMPYALIWTGSSRRLRE